MKVQNTSKGSVANPGIKGYMKVLFKDTLYFRGQIRKNEISIMPGSQHLRPYDLLQTWHSASLWKRHDETK